MYPSRYFGACLLSVGLITCPTASGIDLPAETGDNLIDQGDSIKIRNQAGEVFDCTAGYVDKPNYRVWTAAHCAPDGSEVLDSNLTRIGVLNHRYAGTEQNLVQPNGEADEGLSEYFSRDIAYVQLDSPELAGNNLYSGDSTYVPVKDDEICRYGATTETVYCNQVLSFNDYLIYTPDLYGDAGDSGGPSWVPGKGYVGQAVGALNYTTSDDHNVTITVIHREDLGSVVPLPTDPSSINHYLPSVSELDRPPSQVREPSNVFGKSFPTPSEFDVLLRLNEIRLNKAQGELTRLEELLSQNLENTAALEDQIAKAQEALQKVQLERDEIKEQKLESEKENSQLTDENSDLKQVKDQLEKENSEKETDIQKLDKEYSKLKKDSVIGLSITGILALIGIIAAIAGWFGNGLQSVPGLGRISL